MSAYRTHHDPYTQAFKSTLPMCDSDYRKSHFARAHAHFFCFCSTRGVRAHLAHVYQTLTMTVGAAAVGAYAFATMGIFQVRHSVGDRPASTLMLCCVVAVVLGDAVVHVWRAWAHALDLLHHKQRPH